jgi:hypothetical protein
MRSLIALTLMALGLVALAAACNDGGGGDIRGGVTVPPAEVTQPVRVDISVPADDPKALGPAGASVVIVEFADYQ